MLKFIYGLGIVGWIKNVIWLFHSDFGRITGELIISLIGIVVLPLGGIVGWMH